MTCVVCGGTSVNIYTNGCDNCLKKEITRTDPTVKLIIDAIKAVDPTTQRWGEFGVQFDGAGACWARWNVKFTREITVEERNTIYDEAINPLLDELDNPFSTASYFIFID